MCGNESFPSKLSRELCPVGDVCGGNESSCSFKIDPFLTEKKLREKFLETAPIYKKTPGLIRKNYISNLKNNIAGGVYCFDNMLNAKKWFDEENNN